MSGRAPRVELVEQVTHSEPPFAATAMALSAIPLVISHTQAVRCRRVVALLALTTLATASCHIRISAGSGPSARPTPTQAPRSVKAVLPSIKHFVEQERGLKFKHPVKADVLGDRAFLKQLHKGEKKPKPKEVEALLGSLSSLGLVASTTPIVRAFRTARDDGTLGFYDFKTKRLYVRGEAATPGVRAVLAHELTHALTDQWFGLRRPKLQKRADEQQSAFTALSEGDAERTRMAYEAQALSPEQRQEAETEENGTGSFPHVPRVVLQLIGFPYAVGPQFVSALVGHGGLDALNAAYKHPPVSSEQLINPTAYLAHDEPKPVAKPKAGGKQVDHGDLGYVGLLLMLENGLDQSAALGAIVGWGGDRYTTWRVKGGHHWCLRDSVVMDDSTATTRFDQALTEWVATRGGKALIEKHGKTTTFMTCSD
jgi:hypothetical protein